MSKTSAVCDANTSGTNKGRKPYTFRHLFDNETRKFVPFDELNKPVINKGQLVAKINRYLRYGAAKLYWRLDDSGRRTDQWYVGDINTGKLKRSGVTIPTREHDPNDYERWISYKVQHKRSVFHEDDLPTYATELELLRVPLEFGFVWDRKHLPDDAHWLIRRSRQKGELQPEPCNPGCSPGIGISERFEWTFKV